MLKLFSQKLWMKDSFIKGDHCHLRHKLRFIILDIPCLQRNWFDLIFGTKNLEAGIARKQRHRKFCIWRRTYQRFFFLSGISSTNTDNSQDSRREGTIFDSTLPLPPAHEHSDIYLQLCTWDDFHIFLIEKPVFTRLLLDEIYHIIELLFDWLMM